MPNKNIYYQFFYIIPELLLAYQVFFLHNISKEK
jgi:hypothetical protein